MCVCAQLLRVKELSQKKPSQEEAEEEAGKGGIIRLIMKRRETIKPLPASSSESSAVQSGVRQSSTDPREKLPKVMVSTLSQTRRRRRRRRRTECLKEASGGFAAAAAAATAAN